MQSKSEFKLRVLLLVGIAAALVCSGCNGSCYTDPNAPRFTMKVSPFLIELSPGKVGQVQAQLLDKGDSASTATWSFSKSGTVSSYSKSLVSWTFSPVHGNPTAVTLTARNEIELDGSFHLGNANEFRVELVAAPADEDAGIATGDFRVIAYDLKLGETYRSLKPTYVAAQETLTKYRITRLDTDQLVEVQFDPSPNQYTFEVIGELNHTYILTTKSGTGTYSGGGTEQLGAPTISVKEGTDGKSARIEVSGDFSGARYTKEMSNHAVEIVLTVIAHGPGGRVVKGIFKLTKDTNCTLC